MNDYYYSLWGNQINVVNILVLLSFETPRKKNLLLFQ